MCTLWSSGDDLLARGGIQVADIVDLQVLRVVQHLGDHFAQGRAAGSGGEQHGLLAIDTFGNQTLNVVGKAHVEHAVGFVEHQHFDFLEVEVAGVELLDHTAWVPIKMSGTLRSMAAWTFEVFAAGDDAGLDEGELREALHFLQGLLGELAGRQQDQGLDADADFGRADQTIQNRQDESGGFAAAGLRRHPQVTPLRAPAGWPLLAQA